MSDLTNEELRAKAEEAHASADALMRGYNAAEREAGTYEDLLLKRTGCDCYALRQSCDGQHTRRGAKG